MSNPIAGASHPLRIAPALSGTTPPPVMEARRWLEARPAGAKPELINVSQAAPAAAPPEGLRMAMAEALLQNPASHLYGPVLGLPALRQALSDREQEIYRTDADTGPGPQHVAITAGCNQAFCAALMTVAAPGDDVIIPLPWYFNHAMWCQMQGIGIQTLEPGPGLLPEPEAAARLIGPRTRAIVLVSPNNPGGVAYSPTLIRGFFDLCQRHGIALILDETYRDFLAADGPPHRLFDDPLWDQTLIQLYSFSKAHRLTGHRVGALIAGSSVLREIEKFLDTVTICASQVGQIGALWGLRHLSGWLANERQEILHRGRLMATQIAQLPGWQLLGCGAYFAYLRHPFALSSDSLAPKLVSDAGILLLPGTMFRPEGDAQAARELRIAFANIDAEGITALCARLKTLEMQLAPVSASH
ncbi:MAG: aminotransferase [Pseudomonadota bacterium]